MKIEEKAIRKYGKEHQIKMAIEEMAELIVELSHYNRGRKHHVEEEIADVRLALSHLGFLFGEDKIEKEYQRKTKRLERRIKTNDR